MSDFPASTSPTSTPQATSIQSSPSTQRMLKIDSFLGKNAPNSLFDLPAPLDGDVQVKSDFDMDLIGINEEEPKGAEGMPEEEDEPMQLTPRPGDWESILKERTKQKKIFEAGHTAEHASAVPESVQKMKSFGQGGESAFEKAEKQYTLTHSAESKNHRAMRSPSNPPPTDFTTYPDAANRARPVSCDPRQVETQTDVARRGENLRAQSLRIEAEKIKVDLIRHDILETTTATKPEAHAAKKGALTKLKNMFKKH